MPELSALLASAAHRNQEVSVDASQMTTQADFWARQREREWRLLEQVARASRHAIGTVDAQCELLDHDFYLGTGDDPKLRSQSSQCGRVTRLIEPYTQRVEQTFDARLVAREEPVDAEAQPDAQGSDHEWATTDGEHALSLLVDSRRGGQNPRLGGTAREG